MDRKVRDRIFEEIKSNGKLDKDYVVGLVKTYDERPDVNKLIEQYYKSKADRIVSSFKNENGVRDCFAIKDSQNKTNYIDLSKPEKLTLKEIEIIRARQENAKHKKEEIIKKADVSRDVIIGQVKIEDYEKTLKRKLKNN